MEKMRREDRQVTDRLEICRVLDECDVCRVGFCDEGTVYIVPLNFGYVQREGQLTLYFHSAKEGRKVRLFCRSAAVGFELDCAHKLVTEEKACGYTELYKSIIGTGRPREVAEAEKEDAMRRLMHHYGGGELAIEEEMMRRVRMFALDVSDLTCKEHV